LAHPRIINLHHCTIVPSLEFNLYNLEKVVTLAQELYKLKEEVNEILADQNDINESSRAQLDALSTALAELQASRSQNATLKPRRPIGFIQPKEDE
jgi:uncharacterized coiled-coil protein SlyX